MSTKCKHCAHRAHTGFCTARNGTTAYPCPCIHSSSGVLSGLYWHCPSCGAEEPVTPTGDGDEYAPGDKEPCITCAAGTAYVVKKVCF